MIVIHCRCSVSQLQLVQRLLTTARLRSHITTVLCPLATVRSLSSPDQGLLVVLKLRLKTKGDQAFWLSTSGTVFPSLKKQSIVLRSC